MTDLAELARSILMAPYAKPKPKPCRCDLRNFPHRMDDACREQAERDEANADPYDDPKPSDDASRARDCNKAAR